MAKWVYILCALTSIGCFVLLVRGYWQTRAKLLLWVSVAFLGLAVNNVFLFADLVLFPEADLALLRNWPALVGMAACLYGFVEQSE